MNSVLKRDKLNVDISWLKNESLEDSANLPDPDIIRADARVHAVKLGWARALSLDAFKKKL